jgi:hypothetical protein
MRAARGGPETRRAQAVLEEAPRPAPRSARGGLGVSAWVPRGVLGEATRAHPALPGLGEGRRRERRLRLPSGAPPGPGGRARPGAPPQLQGPCGEGPPTVLAPVARSDTNPPALGGEGADRPRGPGPSAPPPRLEPRPPQAGVRARDPGSPGAHGRRTHDDGPGGAGPGPEAREDGPRARQRALGDAPEALERAASRALRRRPVMPQRAARRPKRRFTARSGRSSVGWRQGVDGVTSAGLGRGGQTVAWQACAPPASAHRPGPPPGRADSQGAPGGRRLRQIDGRSGQGQPAKPATGLRRGSACYRPAGSFNAD